MLFRLVLSVKLLRRESPHSLDSSKCDATRRRMKLKFSLTRKIASLESTAAYATPHAIKFQEYTSKYPIFFNYWKSQN
jgi:hypothetical protein